MGLLLSNKEEAAHFMEKNMLLSQPLSPREAAQKTPLALAFLGDTVWDLLVRGRLLQGTAKAGALHRKAVEQVNAGAQARVVQRIQPHLLPEEEAILRRGQNAHARHAAPKNQDPVAYAAASGLEALLGYLYLTGQNGRILDLFDIGLPIP